MIPSGVRRSAVQTRRLQFGSGAIPGARYEVSSCSGHASGARVFSKQRICTQDYARTSGPSRATGPKMAKAVWPAADLVLIEANPAKVTFLRSDPELQGATVIDTLLGPEEAVVPFHVMKSGSSVFEENSSLERERDKLETATPGRTRHCCGLNQDRCSGLRA